MTFRVGYGFLNDVIDDYIEDKGITKACGDILTIIALRLSQKAEFLNLKEDENVQEGGKQ